MTFIADILLIAGALGLAVYCTVLSRRLSRFTDLENGVGGAVAVLSVQVDDMTKTLERAREAANASSNSLTDMTDRAESVAGRLELLVASLHDIPMQEQEAEGSAPPVVDIPIAEQVPTEPVFVRHRGQTDRASQ